MISLFVLPLGTPVIVLFLFTCVSIRANKEIDSFLAGNLKLFVFFLFEDVVFALFVIVDTTFTHDVYILRSIQ